MLWTHVHTNSVFPIMTTTPKPSKEMWMHICTLYKNKYSLFITNLFIGCLFLYTYACVHVEFVSGERVLHGKTDVYGRSFLGPSVPNVLLSVVITSW